MNEEQEKRFNELCNLLSSAEMIYRVKFEDAKRQMREFIEDISDASFQSGVYSGQESAER